MLEGAQGRFVNLIQRRIFQLQLDLDDLLDLNQKPGINLGQREHLVHTHTQGERIAHIPDTVRPRCAEFAFQHLAVLGFLVHAVHTNLEAAQRFLERLLEGPAHCHHLAYGLHLGGQAGISGRKFLERKTRNLGHHIVNAGFKTRRRCTARDVIAQLVQRVAHGQLGCDLGDRKARGFGGQR